MDLVDEKDISLLQVRKDGGHVCLALQSRPRCGDDVHAHLDGDDVGQSGLAQARGSGQEDVVQRFASIAGRLNEDGKLFAQQGLTREVGQGPWPEGAFDLLVVSELLRVGQPFLG